jgi:hypothetical protein
LEISSLPHPEVPVVCGRPCRGNSTTAGRDGTALFEPSYSALFFNQINSLQLEKTLTNFYLLSFSSRRILASIVSVSRRKKLMRPAVLSISAERVLAPIRNAVLAHAGYGVIPVSTADSALNVLRHRHVCAIVIGNAVSLTDRQRVCAEGQTLHVPSVVLDPYDLGTEDRAELHVNPLDGPEVFLDALAALLQRDHRTCITASF